MRAQIKKIACLLPLAFTLSIRQLLSSSNFLLLNTILVSKGSARESCEVLYEKDYEVATERHLEHIFFNKVKKEESQTNKQEAMLQ